MTRDHYPIRESRTERFERLRRFYGEKCEEYDQYVAWDSESNALHRDKTIRSVCRAAREALTTAPADPIGRFRELTRSLGREARPYIEEVVRAMEGPTLWERIVAWVRGT